MGGAVAWARRGGQNGISSESSADGMLATCGSRPEQPRASRGGNGSMTPDTHDDTPKQVLPASAAAPLWRSASAQVRVELGALSHQGKVRPNNEDCYLVARATRNLEPLLTNLP